jgi:hypothetical protein
VVVLYSGMLVKINPITLIIYLFGMEALSLNPKVITLNPLTSSYFSYPPFQILKFICEKLLCFAYFVISLIIKLKVFYHKMLSPVISALLYFHFCNGSPAIPFQRGAALNPKVITLNQLKSS